MKSAFTRIERESQGSNVNPRRIVEQNTETKKVGIVFNGFQEAKEKLDSNIPLLERMKGIQDFQEVGCDVQVCNLFQKLHFDSKLMDKEGDAVIEVVRKTQDPQVQRDMIDHLIRQSSFSSTLLSGILQIISQMNSSEMYKALINLVRRYQNQLRDHSFILLCCLEKIQSNQEKAGLIACISQSCPEVIKTLSSELFQIAQRLENDSSVRSILKVLIDVNFEFVNQNGERFIQICLHQNSGSSQLVKKGIEKDGSFARNNGSGILELVKASCDHSLFEAFLKEYPEAIVNEKEKFIEIEEECQEEFISPYLQRNSAFGVKYKRDLYNVAFKITKDEKKIALLRALFEGDNHLLETDRPEILGIVCTINEDRVKKIALMEVLKADNHVLKLWERDLLGIVETFHDISHCSPILKDWMIKDPEVLNGILEKIAQITEATLPSVFSETPFKMSLLGEILHTNNENSALSMIKIIKELKNSDVLSSCILLFVEQNKEFSKNHYQDVESCLSRIDDKELKESMTSRIELILSHTH